MRKLFSIVFTVAGALTLLSLALLLAATMLPNLPASERLREKDRAARSQMRPIEFLAATEPALSGTDVHAIRRGLRGRVACREQRRDRDGQPAGSQRRYGHAYPTNQVRLWQHHSRPFHQTT